MANSKLSTHYAFAKPNDIRALNLMNAAARSVVQSLPDIIIAYGVSDEYSFVLHKSTNLFERRAAKLVSTVVSTFTAAYVFLWDEIFAGGSNGGGKGGGGMRLEPGWLPTFDGRAVVYPGVAELRDYLCWRQVDCHINNLYNTTFWYMVLHGGMSTTDAEDELKGTLAADKNEILWSRFGVNYNNEMEMYKKGSVVFREYALDEGEVKRESRDEVVGVTASEIKTTAVPETMSKTQLEKTKKARQKAQVVVEHLDIIKEEFWEKRPWILSGKPGRPVVTVDKDTSS